MNLTGTIDLKGFFAVDDTVRPGYQEVTGTVRLKSSATDESWKCCEPQSMPTARCST